MSPLSDRHKLLRPCNVHHRHIRTLHNAIIINPTACIVIIVIIVIINIIIVIVIVVIDIGIVIVVTITGTIVVSNKCIVAVVIRVVWVDVILVQRRLGVRRILVVR